MPSSRKRFTSLHGALLAGLTALAGLTGCQVDIGGQTLPSPYYLTDDIQYFPAGPEFKLPNEAAELRRQAEQQRLDNRQSSKPSRIPMR